MKIIHRVSIMATPEDQRILATLGVPINASGFVTFEIEESQETWPAVQAWIVERKAGDIVTTKFSKKEISSADWLELRPDWHHGYPQPNEDEFGYRQVTYDLDEYCESCGVGMRQKAPFRLKREPKWGSRGILQLNWVYDEYFVKPEVWAAVFEPHGIACRSVMDVGGVELKTVVQLVVDEEVAVDTSRLTGEVCPRCERTKYLPAARGPFPALLRGPKAAMVKTGEFFGSGGAAHRSVLVSQVLGRTLADAKLRGASMRPSAHEDKNARATNSS